MLFATTTLPSRECRPVLDKPDSSGVGVLDYPAIRNRSGLPLPHSRNGVPPIKDEPVGLSHEEHPLKLAIDATDDARGSYKQSTCSLEQCQSEPNTFTKILILAIEPVRTVELSILLDSFQEASAIAHEKMGYSVRIVSAGPSRNMTSHSGLTFQAHLTFEEFHDQADTIIVAGFGERAASLYDRSFLSWFIRQSTHSRRVGSVSNGALLLAQAGLLNGKRATTHWKSHQLISSEHPKIKMQRDLIFVRDDKFYTCAGSTASVDLALTFIEEDLGPSIAAEVAKSMVVYLRRPGTSPQISATLTAQMQSASPISGLLRWLPENLKHDLSIRALARRVAMSPRNFARHFRREVGTTPAKHIEDLRLDAACIHLRTTTMSVAGVADAVGFSNRETLRRIFQRRLGRTPGCYRGTQT
jgi:transcriptional regulator GlxA family with amidase domain